MTPKKPSIILNANPNGTFTKVILPPGLTPENFRADRETFKVDQHKADRRADRHASVAFYGALGLSAATLVLAAVSLGISEGPKWLGDIKEARLTKTFYAEVKIADQIDAEVGGKLSPLQQKDVIQIVNEFANSHHIDQGKSSFPKSDVRGRTSDVVSQYIYEQTGGKLTRLNEARRYGLESIQMVLPGGEGDPRPLEELRIELESVTAPSSGRPYELYRS